MKNQTKHCRRVTAAQIREFFGMMADEVCKTPGKFALALTGNTFEIHLESATINITVNEAPATAAVAPREGGAA